MRSHPFGPVLLLALPGARATPIVIAAIAGGLTVAARA